MCRRQIVFRWTLTAIFAITAVTVIGCAVSSVKNKNAESGTFTVHVFEKDTCHACHLGSGAIGGSEKLRAPGNQLCFRCHIFKRAKKSVHPALMMGGCLFCHDPHGSRYPFLLRRNVPSLCFECHEEKKILSQSAHKSSPKKCTVCHNPHMSDKKFLLK